MDLNLYGKDNLYSKRVPNHGLNSNNFKYRLIQSGFTGTDSIKANLPDKLTNTSAKPEFRTDKIQKAIRELKFKLGRP